MRHPYFGVAIVGLGTMVVPFDSSVNVAFPHIVRGFGLAIPAIQWVVIAYTLTYAALTLVFGRAGDIAGYRRVFQIGNVAGVVAFLCCAAAPSFGWLCAARVAQGVAAALVLSCGPALATSLFPESRRTPVLALYTMMFGLGSALGPILAGELVQQFGWRAVFWFRAPIALLTFLLTWSLPAPAPMGQKQTFDIPGAVLLVGGITALLFTLNQLHGVTGSPWGFIAAGLTAILCVAGFVRRERATARPILDLRFFRDPDFALITAAHAALNVAGFSIMLLVPFYLDRLGGLSVPLGGWLLACSPWGVVISGPLAARAPAWLPPRRLALCGAICMVVAQGMIGQAGDPANLPVLGVSMVLQGLGLGLFQIACLDITTATLPRADRGVAGSLVMMTRTVGVVTGATLLMLSFQTLRGSALDGGAAEGVAFLAGFQGTFRLAALLPVAVVLAAIWRGWLRAERPAGS